MRVYERDGYACRICGWSVTPPPDYDGRHALGVDFRKPDGNPGFRLLELDHVFPKKLGGKATLDNLQTLCNPCNARKGANI